MTDECFVCGASEDKKFLFEVISSEGIKKVCRNCFDKDEMPLVKKPIANLLKDTEQREQMIHSFEERKDVFSDKSEVLKKQEDELRKVMEKNFKKNDVVEEIPDELAENFHWILMRERRMKKLMQHQLAERIQEPVEAIKMLEKGVLPGGYLDIIKKIEKCLGIALIKKELPEYKEKDLSFDKRNFDELTIDDLRRFEGKDENVVAKPEEDLDDISEEQIREMILKSRLED